MKFSRTKNKFLVILLILVFIAALNFFQKDVKNFFYSISSPIQKNFLKAGANASNFFAGIFEGKNLKTENDALKLEIQALQAENNSLMGLEKENETLREALGIGLEKEFQLLFADFIGKDVSPDLILIDKGEKDGIEKGMPAITSQKVLIGRVSETYKNFSKVMLISNKESVFDAKIEGKEVEGVVKGSGDFNLYFDLVSKDKEIKEGENIFTSSLGGIFPKGLLVGQIKKVKKSDVESYQQAEISPAFNIKEIQSLFIIANFK